MNDPVLAPLYARAIGEAVLQSLESTDATCIQELMERDALDLISKIKRILDDETIDDPDCFVRVDQLVSVFYEAGIADPPPRRIRVKTPPAI